MDQQQLIVKSEDGGDRVSKTKTIYEASAVEILWKNFLAGVGRGLGGVFVYLIFLFVVVGVFINTVLPQIMPMFENYMSIFKSLGSVNSIPQNLDIQKLLGQ